MRNGIGAFTISLVDTWIYCDSSVPVIDGYDVYLFMDSIVLVVVEIQ